MTTIAYRDGVLAADSKAYAGFNSNIGQKTKIRRLRDGSLVGISSNNVGFPELIMRWLDDGANPAETPTVNGEMKCSVLLIKPDGKVHYAYDSLKFTGPLTGEFWAIGSGEAVSLGAMAAGKSAAEAVKIACRFDVWSGLPVKSLKLKGLEE